MTTLNLRTTLAVVQVMPRSTVLAVLAVACLAGCNNPKLVMNPKPEPAKATTPPPPVGGTVNPPKGPTDEFKIQPGKDVGYGPSETKLTDIGSRTDAGILGLQNGKAIAKMVVETSRGTSNGTIDIKVRDAKTYVVGYLLPQTDATPNKLAADGKLKMVYEDRKWTPAKPTEASGPMTPAEIDSWLQKYPKEMFAGLIDGGHVWDRLLAGLQSDVSRTTTVEEQETKFKGVPRPIYRIVSRDKADPKEEMEIVIDGKRWLPLTVKANFKDDAGKPVHTFWTAEWAFGGQFDDKEFVIPAKRP